MKQNIEIEVPEGFEAKYNPETQKIEMVKKNIKPRSWEEYCRNLPENRKGYTITSPGKVIETCECYGRWLENFCETEEEAEAFLAMMKLRQLKKAWVGEWEPEWMSIEDNKWCIIYYGDKIDVMSHVMRHRILSFPTQEMAEEFLSCFSDLIETAKILL